MDTDEKKYKAERSLSALFEKQSQVDAAVRRLLDRGISREHLSVMGRNFESETRISGFITKRDAVLNSLI